MSEIKYQVITISRECGAYGHTTAGLVAEKLGLPYYDKDFIAEASKATGYSDKDIQNEGEEMSPASKFLNEFLGFSASYVSSYDRIHEMQSEVIKKLASEKKCIIVGRCADHILTEAGVSVFKVFLYGDTETKVRHMMELTPDAEEKQVRKQIEKGDIARKTYYKVYTGHELGDCSNYSLCLNTGEMTAEECAEIICKCVQK